MVLVILLISALCLTHLLIGDRTQPQVNTAKEIVELQLNKTLKADTKTKILILRPRSDWQDRDQNFGLETETKPSRLRVRPNTVILV